MQMKDDDKDLIPGLNFKLDFRSNLARPIANSKFDLHVCSTQHEPANSMAVVTLLGSYSLLPAALCLMVHSGCSCLFHYSLQYFKPICYPK